MAEFVAIITAAGKGSRMQAECKKQFLLLQGKSILERTIANFLAMDLFSRSGHLYFSLKDDKATIRGVMFRYYASSLAFVPQNGDEVVCFGKLDIYEAGGVYQIIVSQMEKKGIGDLNKRFEALKKRLAAEGLFDDSHKKKIPKFPQKIGIVTSASGAAAQDIKNVLTRRFPCQIYLYPATVQGDKAVRTILQGIDYFEKVLPVDTLIISRGGGSQEDLFCFNSEELAQAIFAAKTPIISGVGHEIDFTIADFVADMRAPTPSAAAEIAVPDKQDLLEKLESVQSLLKFKAQSKLSAFKQEINLLQQTLLTLSPFTKLKEFDAKIEKNQLKLDHLLSSAFHQMKQRFKTSEGKLAELSPLKTLARGYTVTRQTKKTLRSLDEIDAKKPLEIIFPDGYALVEIKKLKKTNFPQR